MNSAHKNPVLEQGDGVCIPAGGANDSLYKKKPPA
jgi:hypothetical protein